MSKPAWNRLGEKPLTQAERQVRHRLKKYAELDKLPKVTCLCGCGVLISPINKLGKPAKYKHGHNPDGKETQFHPDFTPWNKGIYGIASHMWRNGASSLPYGIGFTRAFKKLIRERDGNKCQYCGKTRKQNWRALEIHHIDHDKMNNDPTNLITVCNKCNIYFSNHRDESLLAFPKRKML